MNYIYFTERTLNMFIRLLILGAILQLTSSVFAQPNQSTWTQVPSPNFSDTRTMIRGISGMSSSDIWAVGTYQTSPVMAQYKSQNLVMRWNGNSWQQYPIASFGINMSDLWAVKMTAVNEGWAAGTYDSYGQGSQATMFRWNGSSWLHHPLPDSNVMISLDGFDAISQNDVWAVGRRTNNVALSLHYNGSAWAQVPVPAVGTYRNFFLSVDGINSNDVWAVGSWGNNYGDYRMLAMHWNGSSWSNTALPAIPAGQLGELLDVKMVSSNDVWAVGYYLTGGKVTLHWDGNSWTEVTPGGAGGALAVINSTNVWAVGGGITNWNGNNWSVIDSLPHLNSPSLGSTVVLPNGDIWAAGRTVDSAGVFKTLVYRIEGNNIPTPPNPPIPPSTPQTPEPPDSIATTADILIYPNPVVSHTINIRLELEAGNYALVIYNLQGQAVYTENFSTNSAVQTKQVVLPSNIINGKYNMVIRNPKYKGSVGFSLL